MKRFSLFFVAMICFSIFAIAGNDTTFVNGTTGKADYKFHKDYNHWSIAFSGGINYFLCDDPEETGSEYRKSHLVGGLNIEGEYTINPVWGVALNYAYTPISKNAIFIRRSGTTVYPGENGHGHQIYPIVNVNLLNLFNRYRDIPAFNWYAGAGVGMFIHNVTGELFKEESERSDRWNVLPMIPFETRFEYNYIGVLGFFVKLNYSIYLRENYTISEKGPMKNWNLYCGVGVRWNINGQKKTHVRIVDMDTYQNPDKNSIRYRTDTAAGNSLDKLEREINAFQREIEEQNRKGCCIAVKAVSEQTDRNAEAIAALQVILDSLKNHVEVYTEIADNSVYFDHNSWVVNEEHQAVVEKIARIMMEHPETSIEIVSFCSKVGTSSNNEIVGINRIKVVLDLLVNKYHIDENRITYRYNGQVFEGLDSENRRCDLKFHQ